MAREFKLNVALLFAVPPIVAVAPFWIRTAPPLIESAPLSFRAPLTVSDSPPAPKLTVPAPVRLPETVTLSFAPVRLSAPEPAPFVSKSVSSPTKTRLAALPLSVRGPCKTTPFSVPPANTSVPPLAITVPPLISPPLPRLRVVPLSTASVVASVKPLMMDRVAPVPLRVAE